MGTGNGSNMMRYVMISVVWSRATRYCICWLLFLHGTINNKQYMELFLWKGSGNLPVQLMISSGISLEPIRFKCGSQLHDGMKSHVEAQAVACAKLLRWP